MSTTTQPLIAIVVGSTRPGRRAEGIAQWVHGLAAARGDATFEIVDLADQALPLYDESLPAMAGRYEHPHTRRWAAAIARFDGFVFVTPEYNHAPPAALKNAIDYLFAEWNDKVAGFVSYGAAGGGVRAVEQLRLVAAELKIATVRAQVTLSLQEDWGDYLDPSSFAPRDHQLPSVAEMLDETVAWSRALRTVRGGSDPAAVDIGQMVGADPRPRRPALGAGDGLLAEARAVAGAFVAELQAGIDGGDARVYNGSFADDVLWGSPFGAVVDGYDTLHAIHSDMLGRRRGGPSRYELVRASAPTPDTVVAHVRRVALDRAADAGFDEMALYVLARHADRWWLAAGQNTPVRDAAEA